MANEQLDRIFDTAARKFNSNVKALDEDVTRLEKWIETQPHLPRMLGKHALRNFLLINKCSVEITKQKIDYYYTIRSKIPEIVYEINPKLPYHKEFKDIIYLVEHPQLTEELYKIYFFKVKGESLPEHFHPKEAAKKFVSMYELRLREDVTCGDIVVFDLKGVTFNVLSKLTPMFLYKTLILIYERAVSARLKAAHLINTTPALRKIVNTTKTIMKPKLTERIHIHSEPDDLKKVIPLDLLPVDFGGKGLSLQDLEDALEAKYARNQELFDRLDEIKIDENLRPDKLKDDENLGFYGNFKKLDID